MEIIREDAEWLFVPTRVWRFGFHFFHFLDSFGFGIEKNWYRKTIGFSIEKNWYRKKIWIRFRSDFGYFGWRFGFETSRFRNFSVSKLFHFLDGFGFGIERIWYRKKYRIRYRKNLVSKIVSDSVSEKFGIGKSFGFSVVQILGILGDVSVSKLLGFETFPFFRWFRFQYRKNLVSKKVLDSVS